MRGSPPMRRKAFDFDAPAQIRPELVVGVVVATSPSVVADLGTLAISTQVIVGHLRVLGLELVAAKARRPWWRPNRKEQP